MSSNNKVIRYLRSCWNIKISDRTIKMHQVNSRVHIIFNSSRRLKMTGWVTINEIGTLEKIHETYCWNFSLTNYRANYLWLWYHIILKHTLSQHCSILYNPKSGRSWYINMFNSNHSRYRSHLSFINIRKWLLIT